MTIRILQGDCLDVLPTLPENSVGSVVTDPPYHLTTGKKGGSGVASVDLSTPYGRTRITVGNGAGGFMGQKWDGGDISMRPETWAAVLRVAKPGAYLLAFGGTRTHHRIVCAIEDAGWEIRDCLGWLYGSGFPKSANGIWGGSALKPAWEPIIMARKPLQGTLAANFARWGTGGLNIDGCRIETDPAIDDPRLGGAGDWASDKMAKNVYEGGYAGVRVGSSPLGRWPANLIHDGSDEVLAVFPQSAGQQGEVRGTEPSGVTNGIYGEFAGRVASPARGDSGSAARFFYTSKASRHDRNDGTKGMMTWANEDQNQSADVLRQLQRVTSDAITLLVDDSAWNTTSYGSSTTGRFRTAIKSIIETTTRPTTPSEISNYLPRWNTSDCIRVAIEIATGHGSSLAELAEFTSQSIAATTDEKTGSVLGVVHAALLMLFRASERARSGNGHPTVKPTDLMRYLCRLVTPPGGTVLDPFAGSGSTLKAAELEGFKAIGIELDAEYVEIARRRVASDMPLFKAP